jgi:hypothetical protein
MMMSECEVCVGGHRGTKVSFSACDGSCSCGWLGAQPADINPAVHPAVHLTDLQKANVILALLRLLSRVLLKLVPFSHRCLLHSLRNRNRGHKLRRRMGNEHDLGMEWGTRGQRCPFQSYSVHKARGGD